MFKSGLVCMMVEGSRPHYVVSVYRLVYVRGTYPMASLQCAGNVALLTVLYVCYDCMLEHWKWYVDVVFSCAMI